MRYLNTPLRRERLQEIKRLISGVSRLNHRIATAIQNNGVTVSNETHSDLNSLCSEITPIVMEEIVSISCFGSNNFKLQN